MASASENEMERGWKLAEGDDIAPGLVAMDRLGGGHRYEAYLSWEERLHSLVVAKLVRPHLIEDEHTLAGLRAEIAMVERLAHPVVVRGFGHELEDGRPRLILEHIEGPRLSTLIRRHGPLPVEQLAPLAIQLCSALHYLESERVAHLDVKPANVIMSGPPRLIDLSVAMDFDRAAGLREVIGTDSYMAPEQCQPERLGPVGAPADVWGVGATLYRAATGERPFGKGESGGSDQERWPQLAIRPAPPERRGVTPEIRDALMAALEFEPRNRPRATELSGAFEKALASQSKPKLAPLKPRWN